MSYMSPIGVTNQNHHTPTTVSAILVAGRGEEVRDKERQMLEIACLSW